MKVKNDFWDEITHRQSANNEPFELDPDDCPTCGEDHGESVPRACETGDGE